MSRCVGRERERYAGGCCVIRFKRYFRHERSLHGALGGPHSRCLPLCMYSYRKVSYYILSVVWYRTDNTPGYLTRLGETPDVIPTRATSLHNPLTSHTSIHLLSIHQHAEPSTPPFCSWSKIRFCPVLPPPGREHRESHGILANLGGGLEPRRHGVSSLSVDWLLSVFRSVSPRHSHCQRRSNGSVQSARGISVGSCCFLHVVMHARHSCTARALFFSFLLPCLAFPPILLHNPTQYHLIPWSRQRSPYGN